jgi:hypothetical protein
MGIHAALKWTTAHETGDKKQSLRSMRMDTHNNMVGVSFYIMHSGQNMRNWTLEKKLIRSSFWKKQLWWFGHGV